MASPIRVEQKGRKIKIQLEMDIPEGASLMECEQIVLAQLNEAGRMATAECIKRFDTDGSPIQVGGVKFTTKGLVSKGYQTPYGEVPVGRHVYQSSQGGATYCPLDVSARIINSTTPRFAQMCSRKYATLKSTQAQQDLRECHGREVSRCYLQDIAEEVAAIAEAKQEHWTYAEPPLEEEVSRVVLSLDGTCVLYCEEGWRSAMVGTISLYDIMGERLHTTYLASPPEYGKGAFLEKMEREIQVYKERYGSIRWIGIADGAKDYWPWLEHYVHDQILDFFHAASYLESAGQAMYRTHHQRREWFEQSRRRLKEEPDAAHSLLEEMQTHLKQSKVSGERRENLEKAAHYFENHLGRMDYAHYRKQSLPIGSGVTEAACKTVVKERMCGSGMKWKHTGASTVLGLRSLILTKGRWEQFWSKIIRFGV